jgi:uncharacterized lipoprotein YddW (UPF0748 family)
MIKISIRIILCLTILISIEVSAQVSPKRELRAAWIASVVNIDWPSKKGLTAQEQQDEYVKLLDHLQSLGMNAVVMQIRPVADAFYPSSYEPWSEYLSGSQGKAPDPYYNPLTFMIEQARQRGLEFHAWFNPYRASMVEGFVPFRNHPLIKNPDWFVQYGGKWYYDPGNPKAREFVLNSIMETVKHYDLDAVHFDDYFYPYRIAKVEFPDDKSYEQYGKNDFANKDDWRRRNVDYFVEELSKRIKEEKPHVKFGISPFGVWRNQDKDPKGSKTQAGQTNYDDLFADVLKWLEKGWVDYITPQIYWHIGFEKAEYKTLVDWWTKNSFGRHVYIGQGAYRVGEKGWEDPFELINQINYNRSIKDLHGSMFFSAKTFIQNQYEINDKIKNIYSNKALVPDMKWIPSEAPGAPSLIEAKGSPDKGLILRWTDNPPKTASYYVIYRFKKGEEIDYENPKYILTIVQRKPYQQQEWLDRQIDKKSEYLYAITAVNRLHIESALSNSFNVKTSGARKEVHLK